MEDVHILFSRLTHPLIATDFLLRLEFELGSECYLVPGQKRDGIHTLQEAVVKGVTDGSSVKVAIKKVLKELPKKIPNAVMVQSSVGRGLPVKRDFYRIKYRLICADQMVPV